MSIPNPNRIAFEIFLEGKEVNNALLGLSVSTTINRIPRARLELNYRQVEKNDGNEDDLYKIDKADTFDDRTKNVRSDFLPGKEVVIRLGRGEKTEEVFRGFITRQNISARSNGALVLYVDCKHAAHRMTLHKRTRFFHHDANNKGSAGEKIDPVDDFAVLKHLVEESADYNLSLNLDRGPGSPPQHENMTQYNCSDWDFLIMRAEALGYVCLPEEDIIRMFKPTVGVSELELKLQRDILEYEAVYDETYRAERNVFTSWEIDEQKANENNLKNSSLSSEVKKVQTAVYTRHGGDISNEEAQSFLSNEVNRQELGKIRGTAKVSGTSTIKVGETLTLSGFESIWDRDGFVSGVKHELRSGTWHSHLQFGLPNKSHAEIYKLQSTAEQGLVPKASGLLYGTVKRYKKSAGGHELVEVELAVTNENDESAGESSKSIYARMATFSAGENGGAVFRPYPNDEVVIGFVNNDPRFPVVLGALYNGKHTPVFDWQDEETQPEVGFSINDWKVSIQEEKKVMTFSSPNGQKFVLDDDEKSIVMDFDGSNQIRISSDGIEMKASKITLNSTNEIEIEGQSFKAKANTSMKLEGGMNLELEGKVSALLKGQVTKIN